MSDLALFGKDPFTDLLDDLSAGIEGDFTGDVYASIDLLFFSLSWNWGISIPVFNYERSPTWPSLPGSGPGATLAERHAARRRRDLQRHRRRRQRHLDPGGQQRPHGRLGERARRARTRRRSPA